MCRKFSFTISPRLVDIGIVVECIAVRGLINRESDPEFDVTKKYELEAVMQNITPEAIASDPILQGFRNLHREMGCANRKNVPASENLLRSLMKTGDIPHVNRLVDIYNLVSVKTRLSLGAHNIEHICGSVCLRETDGTENFWPIGSSGPKPVKDTEYSYVDEANDIICRLEVRQVEKTKVTLDTRDCFFIVQGNRAASARYIASASQELIELTTRFCGGEVEILHRP
jgi:DNA/RNA-binding domain of Phe-tRNA-synthetase-like protein